ncbi:hypothetical protein MMC26_005257 [Xylographa opegraphella]|nr:hypothetical protein [Xylographa opegraphella]
MPTASGNLPQPAYRKQAEIVCLSWNPVSKHRFWTYDHNGTRYIVKGFLFGKIKGVPCPHLVFYIWSGKEGMTLDPKREGFGMRVIALCLVENAKANFSFDVNDESLMQPHRRPFGRKTRNSLVTSEYAGTDFESHEGRSPSSMFSQTSKRESLVLSDTSPYSSDDEPLIHRARRLSRRPAPTTQSSSNPTAITPNPPAKRGIDITINVPPNDSTEVAFHSTGINRLISSIYNLPKVPSTTSSSQPFSPLSSGPTSSLPRHILTQTVLHISSSTSSRGAVPVYLCSCPTMALFYAKIAASWRIEELQIEDVIVTFDWLKDSTPMLVRKEIDDSFEMLLETIQDAPCWNTEGNGRKRCEVKVMVHLKRDLKGSGTPVSKVLDVSNSPMAEEGGSRAGLRLSELGYSCGLTYAWSSYQTDSSLDSDASKLPIQRSLCE